MDPTLYECGVERIPPDRAGPIDVPPCPVCDGGQARPAFAVQGFAPVVVVCTDCGTGRLHPLPSFAEIAAYYPQEYYGETGQKFRPTTEAAVRLLAARSARFLSRGLAPGDRVLDVGCGRGVLLRALADRGLEVHGFEVSEHAARGADPRVHLAIAPDLTAAGLPENHFDRVIIWHVLEHVPDPRSTIREIHRLLRPGGRIVVAVPNFSSWQARWAGPDWFHLDLPRHLWQFPLEGLRRLLESTGFACLSEHHFSLRQNPFGWVQSSLNRSRAVPRNSLYTMLHAGGGNSSARLSAVTRLRLWAMFVLGMPVATALSVLEAACRRGGTVHVVAEARKG